MRVWDAKKGAVLGTIELGAGYVLSMAIHVEELVVGCKDSKIYILDIKTQEKKAILTGHTGWVSVVHCRDVSITSYTRSLVM